MKSTFASVLVLVSIAANCWAAPSSITISNGYALVAGSATLPSSPPMGFQIEEPIMSFTPFMTIYQKGPIGWQPSMPSFAPGYGFIVSSPHNQITLPLPDPSTPVLPLVLPAGYSLVCCQSNASATFDMIVGRSPDEGTKLFRLLTNGLPDPPVEGGETNYAIFSFANGSWTPEAPVANVGEAVWIYQPPVMSSPRLSGNNFTFNALTGWGSKTIIEYSDSLTGTWQTLTNFNGNGGVSNVLDAVDVTTTSPRFYRINLQNNQN